MSRITPARLILRDDGTPWSETFGDVYHSSSGGLEQARAVFLSGNDLPARWRNRERFTIIETGFGLGLNFLATWAAWDEDSQRCDFLHFVSTELHPFTREDLVTAHAFRPELASLITELTDQWPVLTPGFHRLHLANGRVVLTLLFGDARKLFPQLKAQADAFYLDGFSPAANPEMWSEDLIHELPRLAAPGASLATWSVRGALRRTLITAGFECTKRPGFAAKREMLVGRFKDQNHPSAPSSTRHALVVGGGLAGTAIANRLLRRNWRIDLIDAANGPAHGASGNHSGVLRPLPSRDDNRMSRLTRAATLYGLQHLQHLGASVRWDACGALHLARDAKQEAKQLETVFALDDPPEFVRYVDREQAARIAEWPVENGGWWFPRGAWVNPPSLCAANLDACAERLEAHYGRKLTQLENNGTEWIARDVSGQEIARAPVAILANGVGVTQIAQTSAIPVVSARGQVSLLKADPDTPPNVVVCRSGYLSPVIDGLRSIGATFSVADHDAAPREEDNVENLAKLSRMLPGFEAEMVGERVGFRPASPDRLPIVGAVPDKEQPHGGTLSSVPRHRDLYMLSGFGARGLVWSALVAELLASQLNGEPLPIEQELVDAMDPARYVLRPPRRPD